MVHRDAPLTPTGRLRLARCVIEHGWTPRQATERFQVAHTTAKRWADRYRTHGPAGMGDRSSIPRHQPGRTPTHIEQQLVRLRAEHRIGPVRLAASTPHQPHAELDGTPSHHRSPATPQTPRHTTR